MKVRMYRARLAPEGYVSLVKENGAYVCDGRKTFTNADVITDFCRRELRVDENAEERVYGFALDNKCHLNGIFEISKGSVNSSLLPVRDTFQKLLELNAVAFVVVHNHPAGDPSPSNEDIAITKKLKDAGKLMEIQLVDHIIIGNYGTYYSLFNEGRLI